MYDKDTDDFNMMDGNENTGNEPFYEFPGVNKNPGADEIAQKESAVSLFMKDSQIEGESLDDVLAQSQGKPKKEEPKRKNTWVFPAVILLLGFILLGSMVVMYADNIPYVSTIASKIKGNKAPENTIVNNTEDSEISDLLNEVSQDAGITITRTNEGLDPEAMKDPTEIASVGEDGLEPVPGAENQNMQDTVYRYTGNVGRLDPFNPSGGTNPMFDIVVPPTNPTPDKEAAELLTLKISGIMYTPESPSAIINIAGQDQLVRKGDKFNGFSVEKITANKVTVRNKSNTYTASVGEIFSIDSVGVNSIPNLNRKFAGPYSKGRDRIIEINNIN